MITIYGRSVLVFNADKFQFAQDIVQFAGLEITLNGVRPSKAYIEAIENLAAPKNITEVRAFYGMINQVSYAFSMSEVMTPFRHLLRPKTPFLWTKELEDAFVEAKKTIVKAVIDGVTHFEIGRKHILFCDWSKVGLGFLLLQKWCKCEEINPRCCVDGWKLTLAGGRFTSPAESRYYPIEGEALSVSESLQKSKHFVLGCPDLIVATDHKPLVGLFAKSFSEIQNPRLLSIVEKTLWYKFRTIHVPGKFNNGPDYMSRTGETVTSNAMNAHFSSVFVTEVEAGADVSEIDSSLEATVVCALGFDREFKAVTLERVRNATKNDKKLTEIYVQP